jgi:hypothetical protein
LIAGAISRPICYGGPLGANLTHVVPINLDLPTAGSPATTAPVLKYLRTVRRDRLRIHGMVRIECPCSDMILICVCIRTLVLSLAIN